MATIPTRRIRFTAGADGPVLPRSSSAGGMEKQRRGRRGVFTRVVLITVALGTIYYVTRSSLPNSKLARSGTVEGLDDSKWDHNQASHASNTHDTHAHHIHGTPLDSDGSIIVKTQDSPHEAAAATDRSHSTAAAPQPGTMPPAHAVGRTDHSSSSSGVVTTDTHHVINSVSDKELPDPADEPGVEQHSHHHDHPVHAAKLDGHTPPTGLYALTAVDIDGHERHLSEFAGKVALVVNVASECGYTDINYKGLQEVYAKYHEHGFEILAFPSNEFGHQEPGTDAEIKAFCTNKYHTTFPLFSKITVNGAHAHPVYQFLKRELPVEQGGGGGVSAGKDIGWNFYKFLVGRDGNPVKLFHQDWHQGVIEHAVYELLVEPHTQQ